MTKVTFPYPTLAKFLRFHLYFMQLTPILCFLYYSRRKDICIVIKFNNKNVFHICLLGYLSICLFGLNCPLAEACK